MKNRKSKNGRMTASGVAAASPFDALSFSEYSESSSVASACACLAERSDATCSRQAHAPHSHRVITVNLQEQKVNKFLK